MAVLYHSCMKSPDILYYDGRCPLCQREVRLLNRFKSPALILRDLHLEPDSVGEPTRLLKLTTLHLRTADQNWLTGVDAMVRAWSHTRFGFIVAMLNWPGVRLVSAPLYRYWAVRRYRRLYGCTGCGDTMGAD
jgi:predicted DCC family thiol-disulfide oxidoreductase YuxK